MDNTTYTVLLRLRKTESREFKYLRDNQVMITICISFMVHSCKMHLQVVKPFLSSTGQLKVRQWTTYSQCSSVATRLYVLYSSSFMREFPAL